MMSDELSSWKATLFTRFRQAQSALQRLLDERSQLQQYLTHTKRLDLDRVTKKEQKATYAYLLIEVVLDKMFLKVAFQKIFCRASLIRHLFITDISFVLTKSSTLSG